MEYISILLPSYNYAHYMVEAVQSIISQDYPYWELIIIEDGSSDNSLEVALSLANSDERIQVLQHENGINKGLKESLLLGLSKAKHPYIAFLEADDIWEKNALSERIKVMKNENAALVFNAINFISEDGRDISGNQDVHTILTYITQKRQPPQVFTNEILAINLIQTFSSVMVRRDILQKCDFNTPHTPWLDQWLWQQVGLLGMCRYIPQELTCWRLHGQSYIARSKTENSRKRFTHWHTSTIQLLLTHSKSKPLLWLHCAKFFPNTFCYMQRFILRTKAFGVKYIMKKLLQYLHI